MQNFDDFDKESLETLNYFNEKSKFINLNETGNTNNQLNNTNNENKSHNFEERSAFKNSPFGQHWEKRKPNVEEKTIKKEKIQTDKPKIKVNFTIGMFFDGTGNNRFNSEINYYKYIKNINSYLKFIPKDVKLKNKKGEKIEINDSSSYWNPYTNIDCCRSCC